MHFTPTSISEMFKPYKKTLRVKCKEQDVRNAFNAYHNLLDTPCIFKCILCKDSPEIVIFDGNAKLRCSLDFNREINKSVDELDGCVDLHQFWKQNSLATIYRMIGVKEKTLIDFKMAPIMDESVAGSTVYNTEFKKLNLVEDVGQSGHRELTVDQIRDICTKKLSHAELKLKCVELNLQVLNGQSIEDMRSKLVNYFENQTSQASTPNSLIEMNKLFPSYNHSNGGFLFGLCEHGIVYYCKFLVRGEGSRDVLDAVLSFKNRPKFVIYDDAGRLAEHAQKRLGLEEFRRLVGDIQGRILPDNPENIARAKEALRPESARKHLVDRGQESGMYLLYDRFHQNNSKKPSAVLRFMGLVKRLKNVNSQHAEELNRIIRRYSHSLNMCSPELSFNLLKRILSALNSEKNEQITSKRKRQYEIFDE